VIRIRDIEIKWHAVGEVCKWLGIALGVAFLVLTLLNQIPEFKRITQNSPWIPRYIADSLAFLTGMLLIWRISEGRLQDYGFTLAGGNLKLKWSLALGVILGLSGVVIDHLPEIVAGNPFRLAHPYPFTLVNVLGMMSFQWIFVGIFDETITRGLVQTPLMNKLKGSINILKWDFHIGSVITAIIFGVGHFVPHIFFGGSWLTLPPHLIFATLYGLCSSYIYQVTKSLVGPVVMHNVVDGLLYTIDLLFY